MLIADWVAIALIVIFIIFGLIFGFGKGLRFFTKGIFGFVISIFVCYCLGGFIYQLGFVQKLLTMLVDAVAAKEGNFYDFLLAIRIDIIVYYVALFIIVQIVRIIIVKLIVKLLEINNIVFKIINKFLGVIFFCAVLVLIVMFVFQIVYMIGGSAAESFTSWIAGSKLRLDWFYERNPLAKIVELLFKIEIRIPVEVPVEVPG